ncbi:hypothetical protein CCR85_00180 [Rhodothalassium salexigens]|uniref:Bax inhibitor-1/YccA family protein n=1 Tax=Rhodothalassium salexigens TaxID=1086 RepID=UPI001F5D79A4|nr:Bax inhibitor-1/YccA family protein [Rhodothalassium salexigens]MBK5909910.1 hypothetical protein [Rhodothalassium salexigens]MBK5922009.1 hypothetical protein [Rhodothalassium salexigens]
MENRYMRSAGYGATGARSMATDAGLRRYMLGVYNYMASAVLLTGIVSLLVYSNDALSGLFYQMQAGRPVGMTGLGWIATLSPLAFILVLSFGINKLSAAATQALFWTFAVLFGISMSSIFYTYTGQSIAQVFFVTAIAFGGLSLYGYTTKRDLGPVGTFAIMGLIGIIVASLVNIFVASSMMSFIISVAGVLIFAALTAYDTQRIRQTYDMVVGNAEMMKKASVMGALSLYLDFVNLFMMLLSLLGNRE